MRLPDLKEDLKKEKFVIFCLILIIILRIPSLFEPFWYGDEGIYLVLGQAIKKGVTLYSGIHDNKPPLLYMLAALAGNVFWFRAILMIWMMVTLIFLWQLLKKIFKGNERSINLALFLFTILSSIPLIEGNIANSEIFMIGPTILGFLFFIPFILEEKAPPKIKLILSGFFFSISFLLKVPGLFDFLVIFVLSFFVFDFKKTTFKKLLSGLLFTCFGFAIPILISFAYFLLKGAFFEYLTSGFLQNFGYLSSWKTGSITSSGASSQSGLMSRGGILAGILFILYLLKSKLSKKDLFLFLWFFFALFASLLSERPYPHYLIQLLTPAILILSNVIFSKKFLEKTITLFCFLLLGFSIFKVGFWKYKTIDYYRNFISFAKGDLTKEAYFDYFGQNTNQTYQAVEYIVSRTPTDKPIFIWGDEPYLYALSNRLPPGRYTVTYHIVDFNGYEETLKALKENPPSLVVVDKQEKRPFPAFFQFLEEHYQNENQINNLEIYTPIK